MPVNAVIADVSKFTTLSATPITLSDMGFPDTVLDNAVYATLQTSGGTAYFRIDGGVPTQTAGLGLTQGTVRKITGNSNVKNLSVVLKAGESPTTLSVTVFAGGKSSVSTEYYPLYVSAQGYNVWDWDASNIDTLFQDAGITPVTANGQSVYTWRDGVQGIDAVQVTAGNRPTYVANSLNGLATLNFASDHLTTANITLSTFAIWVVFKAVNGGIIYDIGSFETSQGMRATSTTNPTVGVRRGANRSAKDYSTNWGADSTWRILRHEFNGTHATHALALNGNSIVLSGSIFTLDPGTASITQPLRFALRNDGFSQLLGDIAHLCIVSPYPSADIRAGMESYINDKWQVY